MVQQTLSSLPVKASDQIGMFSLDVWVTYINVSNFIKINIERVTKSKRQFCPLELKNISVEYLNKTYPRFIKIFTDGSKDNIGAGAAFVDTYTNNYLKFKIKTNLSIMEIELVAIAEALSYIDSTNYSSVVILTDSKSALQHLARCTSTFRGLPVAYDILKLLLRLHNTSKIIVLQWIPSHIGLDGNELADNLAKQAITDGIPMDITPSFPNYIPTMKKECFNIWKEYFDERSREKGIWYRTIQPHPMSSPWIDNSILSRKEVIIGLRLRSGHIPCNKFSYLMRKNISPNCLTCNVIDDVYHILMECVRNSNSRNNCGVDLGDMSSCNRILTDPLSDDARTLYRLTHRD